MEDNGSQIPWGTCAHNDLLWPHKKAYLEGCSLVKVRFEYLFAAVAAEYDMPYSRLSPRAPAHGTYLEREPANTSLTRAKEASNVSI